MDHRLIFLDIDGTLLPPGDMLIPESTLAALDCAKANGHKLFLCTGRSRVMLPAELTAFGFDGIVGSAGVIAIRLLAVKFHLSLPHLKGEE